MTKDWHKELLTLPDSIFFEIMRTYLGDLKTPFNKHNLLRSLSSMLNNPETRNNIFSLIDQDDARILTAVEMLGNPSIDVLQILTSDFYSFIELHSRIENLQERLLLSVCYTGSTETGRTISLNPLFREEMRDRVLNTELLMPPSGTGTPSQQWLKADILPAFVSFASEAGCLRNIDGSIRKRAESSFADLFAPLLSETSMSASEVVSVLSDIAFGTGIIRNEQQIKASMDGIIEFCRLPERDKALVINAVPVKSAVESACGALITIGEAAGLVSMMDRLLSDSCKYTAAAAEAAAAVALIKILQLQPFNKVLPAEIVKALAKTGFFAVEGGLYQKSVQPVPGGHSGSLQILPNFEIKAFPGADLLNEFEAAVCSVPAGYDKVRSYVLDRKSFSAGMAAGMNLEKLIEAVSDKGRIKLPQNIIFKLENWKKEYQSISLFDGIVMVAGRERMLLIEHSPAFKEFIKANPAQGVYILDRDQEPQWRKALADSGLDMMPEITGVCASPGKPESGTGRLRALPGKFPEAEIFRAELKSEPSAVIDIMQKRLSEGRLGNDDRKRLEAMISKKLILSEDQLRTSRKPEEKGEAGALDHQGKIRLVERAMELNDLLEVTTAGDIELEKRLVIPVGLVKAAGKVPGSRENHRLRCIVLPDERETEIPVRRISRLKMLRSSLFSPM